IGTVMTDTAAVAGGSSPTGTVTFNLYPPSDDNCSGTPAFTNTVDLVNGHAATSNGFAATALGIYRWVAVYNGDAQNNSAVSGCNDEPVSTVAGKRLVRSGSESARALRIGMMFLIFGAVLGS